MQGVDVCKVCGWKSSEKVKTWVSVYYYRMRLASLAPSLTTLKGSCGSLPIAVPITHNVSIILHDSIFQKLSRLMRS